MLLKMLMSIFEQKTTEAVRKPEESFRTTVLSKTASGWERFSYKRLQVPFDWVVRNKCVRFVCRYQGTLTAWTKVWQQSDVMTWHFGTKLDPFPWPIFMLKITTLKACKIMNFKPSLFKLWNCAFLKVNFQNKQKQFSVHRHFNNCIPKWRLGAWDIQELPLLAPNS